LGENEKKAKKVISNATPSSSIGKKGERVRNWGGGAGIIEKLAKETTLDINISYRRKSEEKTSTTEEREEREGGGQ